MSEPLAHTGDHATNRLPAARSTPVSCIVVFRNEKQDLERSLPAVRWCEEVIAVNMGSTDGSLEVAQQWADAIYNAPVYRIHEPARAAAVAHARHDWVLMIDPDEVLPGTLSRRIAEGVPFTDDTAVVELPMWYYLAERQLNGSVWGRLSYKQRLIHRGRAAMLPRCHSLPIVAEGFGKTRIEHDGENHIRHFWSPSYFDLIARHFWRYPGLDAASKVAAGQRLTLDAALLQPWRSLYTSLRHFDGWRDVPRGWLLSLIHAGYQVASHWPMLWYQWRGVPAAVAETPVAPELKLLWRRERVERSEAELRSAA